MSNHWRGRILPFPYVPPVRRVHPVRAWLIRYGLSGLTAGQWVSLVMGATMMLLLIAALMMAPG